MANKVDASDVVYTPSEVGEIVLGAVRERRADPGAGIRLGIPTVDKHLLPLRPGELVSVLGRPGHYKSGLMQFWARGVARELVEKRAGREVVVYITWEMAIEELGLYDLACAAGISASEVQQGRVDDAAMERLERAAMQRAATPLWLIGHSIARRKRRPSLTLSDVARALAWVEDVMGFHPAIIFLDYLQQMEAERQQGQEETRRMDVHGNVCRCKDMALAMGCPVVLGVQAGRQVDDRDWKVPRLGDGAESSNIEHTSDKMIGLWFPAKTEDIGDEIRDTGVKVTPNLLILEVLKQKMGPSGGWFALYVDPARNVIGAMQDEF